jgi:hypothetical protein
VRNRKQGNSTTTAIHQLQIGHDADTIELQIRRYAGKFRRRLRRFGKTCAPYADLLFTFPAACVAVVTGHGSPWSQEEALQLVRSGAALGDVAGALGLPAWLRRLPPEAFDRPLPTSIGVRASDAEFARRIVNTLPRERQRLTSWLQWVLAARDACDDDFAVWVAANRIFDSRRCLPIDCLLPLAIFAWFSRHPELDAAKLMSGLWTPQTGAGRAANLTRRWLLAVLQDLCLEDTATPRDWTQRCHVYGFEFVPLLTSASLAEEGAAMRNCLATYSANVVWGMCRLYSLRRSGLRVANLEIRPVSGTGLPEIAKLLGPGNTHVTHEVYEAAHAWLKLQSQGASEAGSFRCATPTDAAFQKHVWQPYSSAVGGSVCNRLCPPSVAALLEAIAALRILERP